MALGYSVLIYECCQVKQSSDEGISKSMEAQVHFIDKGLT